MYQNNAELCVQDENEDPVKVHSVIMFIISPCFPVFDRRCLDDWSLGSGNHLECLLSSVFPPAEVSQDISQVTPSPPHWLSPCVQAAAAAGAGGHAAPGHLADHLLAADPRPVPGGVSLRHKVVTADSSGQFRTNHRENNSTDPRARW